MQARAINVEGRDAVAIELDVPLAGLKPGTYICQLNVIDDAGGQLSRFRALRCWCGSLRRGAGVAAGGADLRSAASATPYGQCRILTAAGAALQEIGRGEDEFGPRSSNFRVEEGGVRSGWRLSMVRLLANRRPFESVPAR